MAEQSLPLEGFQKESRYRKFIHFETAAFIWGMEFLRYLSINQRGIDWVNTAQAESSDPTNPNFTGPIYTALQHSGDFADGWSVALIGYYALDLLSGPLKKNIPEEAKVAERQIIQISLPG